MNQELRPFIINNNVYYDNQTKENASLYLCFSPDTSAQVVTDTIASLQKPDLWSLSEPAIIRDEQKSFYVEQLAFIDSATYQIDNGISFSAICCNHEKFPYNKERWQQWTNELEKHYRKVD